MHNKEVLAEFIYKLDAENNFTAQTSLWSAPVKGFSYNNSLSRKLLESIRTAQILHEDINSLICALADWETVAEGIFFSDTAIYVNSPKNTEKNFYIKYEDITNLEYDSNNIRLIIFADNRRHYINHKMWSKILIHDFLEFACETYGFHDKYSEVINQIKLQSVSNAEIGAIAAGLTYGGINSANANYNMDKFASPRGHGFVAEQANHMADVLRGKNAQIVGNDNATHGPDRLVDGVYIQTKYCSSGSKCIQQCFENGKFKYYNADGSPMQIEVPSDMYEAAIKAMENRIATGQIEGVTDVSEAKNLVRKGHYKYNQVKNMAKAGTIDSLIYDAQQGICMSAYSGGITAAITFAVGVWNGDSPEIALRNSVVHGLKTGGLVWASHILASQLLRAGLNSAMVGSTEAIVQAMGPKASALIVNAFRSGSKIYGAAATKSAAKMLRGNIAVNAVMFGILTIGDVGNIFQGRISGKQLFKNMTETASSLAGAAAGFTAGAAVGSVVPVVGTFIGGLAGAFLGGMGASKVSNSVVGQFIEDDADEMIKIIQTVFTELAEDYLVNQNEAEEITEKLKERLTGATLKDMFASSNQYDFARELLTDYFEETARNRPHITLPNDEQISNTLKSVLEEIASMQDDAEPQGAY